MGVGKVGGMCVFDACRKNVHTLMLSAVDRPEQDSKASLQAI